LAEEYCIYDLTLRGVGDVTIGKSDGGETIEVGEFNDKNNQQ
jgi:hypothetical protein